MPYTTVKATKLKPGDRIVLCGGKVITVQEVEILRQGPKQGQCPRLVKTDRFPNGTTAQPDALFHVLNEGEEPPPEKPPLPGDTKLPKVTDPRDEEEAKLLLDDEQKKGQKFL